ncbi:MAG TPA: DUF3617 family protein [Casimicrobiaceae bacterium]
MRPARVASTRFARGASLLLAGRPTRSDTGIARGESRLAADARGSARCQRFKEAACVAAALLLFAAAARAQEPPAFRQGLWQFDRAVGGQKRQTKECTNPTEEIKRQNAMLTKSGCKLTPTRRSGNAYTFSAECTINAPAGAPVTARSTSVMTVESDSAYKVEITTTGAGTSTDELLLARRIGDCQK